MRWIVLVTLCIGTSGCGVAHQPESSKTVAAYEIPLRSQVERERFLSVLRHIAKSEGMHVDAVTQQELEREAKVSPTFKMTLNAAVWRGASDEEPIASAMDQFDHLGDVWIFFYRGEDPMLNSRFREATMNEVMHNWPETLSLPITPSGGIPLHRDLIRTPTGYVVSATAADRYEPHDGKRSFR